MDDRAQSLGSTFITFFQASSLLIKEAATMAGNLTASNMTVSGNYTSLIGNYTDSELKFGVANSDQFRSLPRIILSCFTTIILCNWVSLHLNIAKPIDVNGSIRTRYKRLLLRFFRDRVVPSIVALACPEWILVWAFLQRQVAHRIAKKLCELSLERKALSYL